eukprot:9329978-Alexandrium_andersonii.AAC.1
MCIRDSVQPHPPHQPDAFTALPPRRPADSGGAPSRSSASAGAGARGDIRTRKRGRALLGNCACCSLSW